MAGGGGGGGEYDVQLNLVPLIDILTNILFFLLVGFASTDSKYEGRLRLPSADTNIPPKSAVNIEIAKDQLVVEDLPIAKVAGGKVLAPTDGDKIIPLYEKLNAVRKAKGAGPTTEDSDVVWLLCDRETPFTILSPVMKTAAMAGYPNFRFAVVKK
ncbi:MAG: biopolymer transporter ExbD [Deltaproteobacteria bacterium]|nr:biopolymer transporter ExbD [Deltaproteobacteria bacterium]